MTYINSDWEDGGQYAALIIGFEFVPSERLPGKSGNLPSMAISSGAKTPASHGM